MTELGHYTKSMLNSRHVKLKNATLSSDASIQGFADLIANIKTIKYVNTTNPTIDLLSLKYILR